MKVIFCVVAFAFCVVLAFPETTSAPKYPVKYDNIDVDIILNTDRLLKSYVDCLLEKTKCHTKQAQLLKRKCFRVDSFNILIVFLSHSFKNLKLDFKYFID